jgi:hypothetical protein
MKHLNKLFNKSIGNQFQKFNFLQMSNLYYYRGLTKVFSSVYVNHRDLPGNDEQAPFDFTEENYVKVEEILVSNKKLFFRLDILK